VVKPRSHACSYRSRPAWWAGIMALVEGRVAKPRRFSPLFRNALRPDWTEWTSDQSASVLSDRSAQDHIVFSMEGLT
jgi:hypothetical protein